MSKVVDLTPKLRTTPKMRYKCVCGNLEFEVGVYGLICTGCGGIHPMLDVLMEIEHPTPRP